MAEITDVEKLVSGSKYILQPKIKEEGIDDVTAVFTKDGEKYNFFFPDSDDDDTKNFPTNKQGVESLLKRYNILPSTSGGRRRRTHKRRSHKHKRRSHKHKRRSHKRKY